MPESEKGLEVADIVQVAITAGAAIMDVYASCFEVRLKQDASPVTDADLRAEQLIIADLRARAPHIPVIAEESVSAGRVPELPARFFLVDPLDGTREFVARSDEFTVNIALVEHGEPILGVIFAPAMGEVAFATRTGGAFAARVEDGALLDLRPIRARPCPGPGGRALVSRSHRDPRTTEALARFAPAETVPLGSSLKFCRIAEGRADIYPRHGVTMQWDTAAGDAILRAAGGCVVTETGAPLRYGHSGASAACDFRNPAFFAFGDPALVALLDAPQRGDAKPG